MTEAEAVETILQTWKTGWEALHPADTAQAASVPWFPEDKITSPPDRLGVLGSWALIVVRMATAEQLSQGSIATTEYGGVVMVKLCGPMNQGTRPLNALCDDVRKVLAQRRVGELRLHEGTSSRPRNGNDGQWVSRVVTIPFHYTATGPIS